MIKLIIQLLRLIHLSKHLKIILKDKAITLYESDMNDSYKIVKEYLDTEKAIHLFVNDIKQLKMKLTNCVKDAKQKSQDYLQELEDDFNNRQYRGI